MVHWFAFCGLVALLLALDLLVFHRKSHEPSLRESAGWTIFWIALALAFNAFIWHWGRSVLGTSDAGLAFFIAYLVEKSLSMDNVFVFLVIFAYFHVPLKYQYRVLFWGILGAIAMRLTFILAAVEMLKRFEWVLYIFGVFLLYTGVKLALHHGAQSSPEQNVVVRWARRVLPVAHGSHEDHFFVRENGRLCVTPLFLVLLCIESSDVVFAIDSVPAVLGVTQDPFIVFTSNVFAILGLRALYFLLAGVMNLFRYLSYGLASVLVFIGLKMLIKEVYHFDNRVSLAVIFGLLATSIIASLIAARRDQNRPPPDPAVDSTVHESSPPRETPTATNPADKAEPS
jgi:tellurite resistance protein TerC